MFNMFFLINIMPFLENLKFTASSSTLQEIVLTAVRLWGAALENASARLKAHRGKVL